MPRCLILIAVLMAALPTGRAAALTYNLDLLVTDGSVAGTVETNGTLGTLSTADIIDWHITVENGADSFILIGDGQPSDNSDVLIVGTSVSATERRLRFNFNGAGFLLFQAPALGSGDTFFCVQNSGCSGVIEDTFIGNPTTEPSGIFTGPVFSGNSSFAENSAAPIPVPATAGLLAGAFLCLGGYRRRTKPLSC